MLVRAEIVVQPLGGRTGAVVGWCVLGLLMVLMGVGCSREGRVERGMKRAEAYYEAQDYERARLEYLKVLVRVTSNRPHWATICGGPERPAAGAWAGSSSNAVSGSQTLFLAR